jgi:hypothetical protein
MNGGHAGDGSSRHLRCNLGNPREGAFPFQTAMNWFGLLRLHKMAIGESLIAPQSLSPLDRPWFTGPRLSAPFRGAC